VRTIFYCTYDHQISLPKRYLTLYHLKKFVTHNFVTYVLMKINNKTIFDGLVRKEDFYDVLKDSEELKKYGVLFDSPTPKIENGMLSLFYSITIPLTDVGGGFTIRIDSLGKKHVYSE